jgi:serine/threonine-protein kinase
VLFTIVPEGSIEGAQIALLDLTTRQTTTVMERGNAARYVPTGHLVYASGQTLSAIGFDPAARRTYGDPVTFRDIAVANAADSAAAGFAVSETGTLISIAPDAFTQRIRTLWWVDRRGNEEALPIAPGQYLYPRISPDGSRVALDVRGENRDIWIWNTQRPTLTKLTNGPTEDMVPMWSRDGRRLYFASDRTGNFDVYSQAADGATTERVEFAGPGVQVPVSLTPDNTGLIVLENFRDIGMIDLAKPHQLEPLLHSNFIEALAEVSPDGQWIAYESNESGNQMEIFLRPFSDLTGRREKVSIDGGRYPKWGRTGTGELFYMDLKGVMQAASITLSPSLQLGRVTPLFQWTAPPPNVGGQAYDISPIDGRFLMTRAAAEAGGPVDVSVVLNWFEELRERVPLRAR